MRNKNMYFRNFCKLTMTTCASVALMFPYKSFAVLWQLEPSIALEGRYDDNIRLTTEAHDSVTAALLNGSLGFSRLTETGGVTGRLHVNLSDYSGDDEVTDNNNNAFLTFAAKHNTELTRWGLSGSARRDTSLRSVDTFQDSDDDQVVDDQVDGDQVDGDQVDGDIDEGLVNIDVRRNALTLSPSWEHSLNERTKLGVIYNFSTARYEDNPTGSGLFDYDNHTLSGTFSRRLSERDTFNSVLEISRFESPDNNNNKTDSIDFTVGYQRAFSEVTTGSIDVGLRESSVENDFQDYDDNGFILRLSVNHRTELNSYTLSFENKLQASGSGEAVESTGLNLSMRRRFSQRLSGFLRIQAFENRSINDSVNDDRRYISVSPRLLWKMTRWWDLGAGYTYRSNERDSTPGRAESNMAFVSIGYNKKIAQD